ncbi:MAG: hypothetical protein KU37_08675 [Sulfuricurvum sp. PC08-66]|nr:MAG: hypothetical protein KU37_08675 [Sulfuricurvum sp. PC08-66]
MKKLPEFKTQEEERAFWEENDVVDYFDTATAKVVKFSKLKKSTKTISLRLPEDMLERLKIRANALDVPYQSLIKILLEKELRLGA